MLTREMLLTRMARAYYDLLAVVVPLMKKDKDIEKGIREGLNKFLSNLCISLVGKLETNYYSKDAIKELAKGGPKKDQATLIYEHMVPKNYYQDKIINDFKEGKIKTPDEIRDTLEKYWHIATITSEEDKRLVPRKSMPKGWDGKDIFVRYVNIRDQLVARAEYRGKDFPERQAK